MRQLKITKQVTNRETASLDKYLQEIGKVELITAEEEVKSEKESEETVLEAFTETINQLFCQRKLASTANFIAFSQGIPLFVFHHSWKTHFS